MVLKERPILIVIHLRFYSHSHARFLYFCSWPSSIFAAKEAHMDVYGVGERVGVISHTCSKIMPRERVVTQRSRIKYSSNVNSLR